ncbi:MAG: exopolysaccharide biosynthesis polyprenyl glycosylphosphotransferase [Candidatus Gastranaerophilaceae bacterium]
MPAISKSVYILSIIDAFIIALAAMYTFISFIPHTILLYIALWFLVVTMLVLNLKGLYKIKTYRPKNLYMLFEGVTISTVIAGIPICLINFNILTVLLLIINAVCVFSGILFIRIVQLTYTKCFKSTKNVLIVGAGQDGKLIAEEIQARPALKLKVVGFLDDNMNTIEDEDSTIPILGLTCDSEAVIKDNNVKIVIVAVKSRMDSVILTDLIKGIPLGVKVWRMPKFYEKITHKYLVSKMTVNWLFYACVKKKALLFTYIKRFCDIISSIAIMLVTIPLSIIAVVIIKFSDFGPIFFTQTRIGKFGKPFKMIKFRTMYQDKVEEDFDEDIDQVHADDKRIMPFCKFLRKFHIDELPQMINVLRGEMSIVGPRPVREEVYYENREKVPFWECRNWVRPGWCGWQQINMTEPTSEERLEYDLYYIKHRHIVWEFLILLQFIAKVICGRG